MKNLAWQIILCLTIVAVGKAQPNWLKKTLRDVQVLSAHEEATAIILYDTKDVIISSGGRTKIHIRQAFKILKPEGRNFGVMTEWVAPFRKIKNLKGWTILADGKKHKYSSKQKIEISTSEASGYYDDSRRCVLSMDKVEPGAIAAFEYDIEETEWSNLLQSFEFQRQQPVRFARFTIELPKGWQLHIAEWHTNKRVVYNKQNRQHTWTATNLPYRPEEPLMPSWNYLARRVEVACYNPVGAGLLQFSDWSSAAKWCAQVFSEPAKLDESVRIFTQQLTAKLQSPIEKVNAIAEFVRDQIHYRAIEIGKGRWYPRAASVTLYNRYGDCKDKTTLMRALLKAAGIPSAPVFANSSRSVQPRLPTPFQFNHCIVGIPTNSISDDSTLDNAISNGWLFFDPTHHSTRLGDLPYVLKSSRVLVGTNLDSALIRLPELTPDSYRRHYFVEAQLSKDGSISANVVVTDYGNRALESHYDHRTTTIAEQIEYWKQSLSKNVAALELSNYQISPLGDSVWVSFNLRARSYGQKIGDLLLFKPDFFMMNSPPALTSRTRLQPIWFGAPMRIEKSFVWHLPEGWHPERSHVPIESSAGTTSYSYKTEIVNNVLHYRVSYEQTGFLLSAEDYLSARKFSQDLSHLSGLIMTLQNSTIGAK